MDAHKLTGRLALAAVAVAAMQVSGVGREQEEGEAACGSFSLSEKKKLASLSNRLSSASLSLFRLPCKRRHGGASPSQRLPLLPLSAAATSSRDEILGPGVVELGWKRQEGLRAGARLGGHAFHSREQSKKNREEATNQLDRRSPLA